MAVEEEQEPDIFYVLGTQLEALEKKIKANEDITQADVEKLTLPDEANDDDIMVPVDMNGVGEEFEDVEAMITKLKPKGTVEAFLKARKLFVDAPGDESEKPQEMTAAEWRAHMEEGALEELEEEFGEGDEEELEDLGEEVEEEIDEPPEKKQKTA